jgi:hypothetical protein
VREVNVVVGHLSVLPVPVNVATKTHTFQVLGSNVVCDAKPGQSTGHSMMNGQVESEDLVVDLNNESTESVVHPLNDEVKVV